MKKSNSSTVYPVTAIIPVKNGMVFLPKFIEANSELFHTLNEVIFINDFSVDETYNFLTSKLHNFANFSIVNNNLPGLSNALNLAIKIARNPWLARFDVDDEYSQDRLLFQFPLVGDSVGAVFSDYEVVDSLGKPAGIITSPLIPVLTELSLINNRRTPHPSALLNRSAVIEVGSYKEGEFPAEDLGLWIRLVANGYELRSTSQLALTYKIHYGSITTQKNLQMKEAKRNLLRQHNFLSSYFMTLNNWHLYMKFFSDYPRAYQRRFLSCLDLMKVHRDLKKDGVPVYNFIYLKLIPTLANPVVLCAGVYYALMAMRRRQLRRSYKNL